MDILDHPDELNFRDETWRIYSRNPVKPAHYISAKAKVSRSGMTDGCQIFGTVDHSILSHSVYIESGAVVRDCVLMPGVRVKKGAVLEKVIVGIDTVIGENCRIGGEIDPENPYYNEVICSDNITLIDGGLVLKKGAVVPGNCMVTYGVCDGEEDVIDRVEHISTF